MKRPIWQGTYWRTCNQSWWVGYSGLAWGGSQVFGTLFLYFYGLLWWSWIHIVCSQWFQVLSRRQGLPLYSSLIVHWSRQSCLGRKQWGTLQFTCTLLSWSAALARSITLGMSSRNSLRQSMISLVPVGAAWGELPPHRLVQVVGHAQISTIRRDSINLWFTVFFQNP